MSTDLTGESYISILNRLHTVLKPSSYLEIGVFSGQSLASVACRSIAIDPDFQIASDYIAGVLSKPETYFFRMGSDEFFARHDPTQIFGGPVEMAFLDGMHRCEFLLRDFINVERHARPNAIIAMHDCLPVEAGIATRLEADKASVVPHRQGWWTGDVWRTALLLRRYRPDLEMTVLDSGPTGLVLITNLDPQSRLLADDYGRFVREMLTWDLEQIGVPNFFAEIGLESTQVLQREEDITGRFWL